MTKLQTSSGVYILEFCIWWCKCVYHCLFCRWSAEFGAHRIGSPELHDMLAEYIYSESPEAVGAEESPHIGFSDSLSFLSRCKVSEVFHNVTCFPWFSIMIKSLSQIYKAHRNGKPLRVLTYTYNWCFCRVDRYCLFYGIWRIFLLFYVQSEKAIAANICIRVTSSKSLGVAEWFSSGIGKSRGRSFIKLTRRHILIYNVFWSKLYFDDEIKFPTASSRKYPKAITSRVELDIGSDV